MSLEEQERQDLIVYRLEQAEETIVDVALLLAKDRFRSAVNRIYYGIFYALVALGVANHFETSKHAKLIGWFNQHFIHGGLMDAKYGKLVNKAFNRRTKGDYDAYVEFGKKQF
jgi:uncharacterized protein (UPF0332 family)